MVSTMYCFLAVFLLTVPYLSCAEADFDKHIPLVSDIHNAYGTSGIFFVFPRKKFSMEEYTTAYSLTRYYSRQGVSTLMTNFEDLSVHLSHNWKRTARPLVVVLVKSIDDINEFHERTQKRTKSFPIWLLIFRGQSIDPVCEYCRRPEGNRLGLRFDTLMRVICCHEEELQEWWSVRKNHTETSPIGTWSADERLKLVATDKLKSRRRNLHGAEICLGPEAKDSWEHLEWSDYSLNNDIKKLERDLQCKIIPPNKSMRNISYGSESECREAADLTASFVSSDKWTAFTYVIGETVDLFPINLYIKVSGTIGFHSAHFKVFGSKIWLIIIALVVMTPVLLTIMKLQQGAKLSWSLYSENCLCVWGIFCQQGISKFSLPTSMRIAYFSLFISGVIVYVAYSASLTSILFITSSTLPFSDVPGFLKDGSYKIIVPRTEWDFVLSQPSLLREILPEKMIMLIKPTEDLPKTMMDAWRQVCSERVALVAEQPLRKPSWDNCKLIEINYQPATRRVIPIAPDSQYADALIYHDRQFRKREWGQIYQKYYPHQNDVPQTMDNVPEFVPVNGIVFILIGGMILSLIVFFCETIYYRRNNRQLGPFLHAKPRNMKMRNYIHARKRQHLRTKNRRLTLLSSVRKLKTSVIRYHS